jgi:hypothetical protein
VTDTARAPSRFRQKSSAPCGTENDVTVAWPAPLRPSGTPRSWYGNVVQIVPGVP